MDVDYAVEDALKKSPLSSQNPLRPYQKKTLERTNTTPKPYKGAPAKAAGGSTTPAKAAATSEKAASAPAKKSWNPFNKKTDAAAATDASGAAAKKSSSWNPFGKKEPNPDEIKHVKVGGGLINKFRTAEKMRTSAAKKIDAQVKAGGLTGKTLGRVDVFENGTNGGSAVECLFQDDPARHKSGLVDGQPVDADSAVDIEKARRSRSNMGPLSSRNRFRPRGPTPLRKRSAGLTETLLPDQFVVHNDVLLWQYSYPSPSPLSRIVCDRGSLLISLDAGHGPRLPRSICEREVSVLFVCLLDGGDAECNMQSNSDT
ncbi:hypothetical protein DFJ73DRAFT_968811, partial [Zopfochytrium polystomum]